MSSRIFPIGQFGGVRGSNRFPVRLGPAVIELDTASFAAWAFSHGRPDSEGEWTAQDTAGALAAKGIPDGPQRLADLTERGLIAAADPADAEEFARRHRLAPLLLGMGEAGAAPGAAPLEPSGSPAVLDPMFALWALSPSAPSIWAVCRRFADDAAELGMDDGTLTDTTRLLRGLLSSLHPLLAVNAAYLDVVS